MYSKILFATDLTESSIDMCKQAVKLSKQLQAELYLVHVIEIPSSFQYAHTLGFAELTKPNINEVSEILNTMANQFNIAKEQQIIEIGNAKKKILDTAIRYGCDLIIVGSHSNSDSLHRLGGVSQAIVHDADIAVLTLRKQ
jgi:nucleotide-binding universal stress UspA family protein